MFTTSCFIRKNRSKLRKKLDELGYMEWIEDGYDYLGCFTTVIYKDAYYRALDEDHYDSFKEEYNPIDCGKNEKLFLAIAALRDDSDYMQWFICDKDMPDSGFAKGKFYLSRENNFENTWNNSAFLRKATVKELITHFNK